MVKKVDDNHNEVLRGAAEYDATDDKYNIRVNNKGKTSFAPTEFDFMLNSEMILKSILKELRILNAHMREMTGEEIEDTQ